VLALSVACRAAFAVGNPITRDNATAGTRYPLAVVNAATGG
jgi:hypothetical protein